MNDPPTGPGGPRLGGTTNLAGWPGGLGSAGVWAPRVPLAPDAPCSAVAGPSGSPGGAHKDGGSGENVDSESWVREKVLFLLHPERWLGTRKDPEREEPACGADLDDWDRGCPSARLGPRERAPGGVDPAVPAQLPNSAAPGKPVLVRVVDYQVTQEVQCRAWTKGQMTTCTEERSVTAVTFRTGKE